MYFSGIGNDSSLGEKSLTLGSKLWRFRSFLTWTKHHELLHRHQETSLEVVEETLLTLQENQRDFLLELDDSVSKWMFSGLDLLQQV